MMRAFTLIWIALGTAAQTAEPQADINPALIYWQGIALQSPSSESKTVSLLSEILAEHPGKDAASLSARIAALDGENELALNRLKRATASKAKCEWGISFDEGPHAPMPHIPKMQQLARLSLLRAERFFQESRHAEALDWSIATHHAARDLGSDEVLVAVLGEQGLEADAIRLLARHVPRLDEAARKAHLSRMSDLPPAHSLAAGIRGEKRIAHWMRGFVLGVEASEDQEAAILEITRGLMDAQQTTSDPEIAEDARKSMQALESLKENADKAAALFARIDQLFELNWLDGLKETEAVVAEIARLPAAIRNLFPNVAYCRQKEFEMRTLHTMLRAALTYGSSLPEGQLTAFKDSFTGAPLLAEKKPDGRMVIRLQQKVNRRDLILRLY